MASKLALVALLIFSGCNSGTRDPAGGGGSGGAGGAGGSGNPGACAGAINGSCRYNTGSDCIEYAGLPAAEVSPIAIACGDDNLGTWTGGSACNRTGAVGGCRFVEGTACVVYWTYEGTAAEAMSDCVGDGFTWITP